MAGKFIKGLAKPECAGITVTFRQSEIEPGKVAVRFTKDNFNREYILGEDDFGLSNRLIGSYMAALLTSFMVDLDVIREEKGDRDGYM